MQKRYSIIKVFLLTTGKIKNITMFDDFYHFKNVFLLLIDKIFTNKKHNDLHFIF